MKPSLAFVPLLVPLLAACGSHHGENDLAEVFPVRHTKGMPEMPADATLADAPPFKNPDTEDCSDCHDPDFMEIDPTPREIGGDHEDMTPFAHAVGRIWCLNCHDAEDRDMLRLSSGELIEFEEAPTLCGQCHGDLYREWVAGVHGKRTGNWSGPQEYMPCSSCHDPHSPLFQPLEPMSGPLKPEAKR